MTERNAPPLETRSADQVVAALRERTRFAAADPFANALFNIVGRYFEILAARLNLAPDKHRLVFLDLLGARPAPPGAARAPLTFFPVQQLGQIERLGPGMDSVPPATVPARTQVAASAPAGANGVPPVFETEATLELTSAVLQQVLAHDPQLDCVADLSVLATQASDVRLFVDGMRPARHELYIAWPAGLGEDVSSVGVHFDIEPGAFDTARQGVEWYMAGASPRRLRPLSDTTNGLTRPGEVIFADFGSWPAFTVDGVEARWLCCRLMPSPRRSNSARDTQDGAPAIRGIGMSARIEARSVVAENAFFNAQPLDLSTGFYPLGFSPRFGDAFYLGSSLFAYGGAAIRLEIELASATPSPQDPADLSVRLMEKPPLVWEGLSDGIWVPLEVEDGTQGLLVSGAVAFRLPRGAGPATVHGVESGWIRIRVAGLAVRDRGPIGAPVAGPGEGTPAFVPARPYLPAIERVRIDAYRTLPPIAVTSLVRMNDASCTRVPLTASVPVPVFQRIATDHRALYLKFNAPARDIASGTSIFFFLHESPEGFVSDSDEWTAASVRAEYWDGRGWRGVDLVDATHGLTRTGSIAFRCERPWCPGAFGQDGSYWARLVWHEAQQPRAGRIMRIALNTVMAINALSAENELLGSSDGTANQVYACTRRPVIGEFQLEVREPGIAAAAPSPQRRVGERAMRLASEASLIASQREHWMRWQAVESLAHSGPDDRHYLLDPWTGTVRFGDGLSGRIPPAGANNIRVRRYRYGGGSGGNVAARTITELRSTVSYVAAVTNLLPATGGSDRESAERIGNRGSSWLRHRDRAVTREDYEELAVAVPGIARAHCLALRDLAADRGGKRVYPGRVSLIVVPDDPAACPKPTAAQLKRVHQHLANRKPPEVDLTVLAPSYVTVDVSADLFCDDDEDTGQLAVRCRSHLDAYLHPLNGGPEQDGWRFGQHPVQSGVQALLQRVEGVRQVQSVRLTFREEYAGLLNTRLYLVCSGRHDIRCAVAPRFAMEAES